jgi:cytochrome d ubiquinol oxidase subunit II
MNLAMFVCVLGVFIAAFRKDIPLASWVFGNSVGLAAVTCSVISLVLVWTMINQGKVRAMRFFTGLMVATLLAAVTYAHFPHIVLFKNGDSLSLLKTGSAKAIQTLGIALLSGSILILPAFIYLVYRFGRKDDRETHVVD